MKRILALALLLLLAIGMPVSCNTTGNGENAEADTLTQASTGTDTDNETNEPNEQEVKITVNTLLPSLQIGYSVYDEYHLGKYLGDEIPGAKSHTEGSYYKIIKSYEELSALVEYPEKITEDFFEQNYILAIGVCEKPALTASTVWSAYDNLYYEQHADALKIDRYVEYKQYLEVLGDCTVSNVYIGISQKSLYLRDYYSKLDSGALIINDINYKYYALDETELECTREITELEIGSCFVFDYYSYDDGYDMFEEYGVKLKDEEWPHNCETNFRYVAVYARHCEHHVSYENAHIADGKIYLTQNTLEHDGGAMKYPRQ